jgi:hypothetical protein
METPQEGRALPTRRAGLGLSPSCYSLEQFIQAGKK